MNLDADRQLRSALVHLQAEGRKKLRPSLLVERSGLSKRVLAPLLERLVADGELDRRYQVLCPVCHASQGSYTSVEKALRHDEPCADCDEDDAPDPVAPSRASELDVVLTISQHFRGVYR